MSMHTIGEVNLASVKSTSIRDSSFMCDVVVIFLVLLEMRSVT